MKRIYVFKFIDFGFANGTTNTVVLLRMRRMRRLAALSKRLSRQHLLEWFVHCTAFGSLRCCHCKPSIREPADLAACTIHTTAKNPPEKTHGTLVWAQQFSTVAVCTHVHRTPHRMCVVCTLVWARLFRAVECRLAWLCVWLNRLRPFSYVRGSDTITTFSVCVRAMCCVVCSRE